MDSFLGERSNLLSELASLCQVWENTKGLREKKKMKCLYGPRGGGLMMLIFFSISSYLSHRRAHRFPVLGLPQILRRVLCGRDHFGPVGFRPLPSGRGSVPDPLAHDQGGPAENDPVLSPSHLQNRARARVAESDEAASAMVLGLLDK